MRVPTKFFFDSMKDRVIKNQSDIQELQRKISSGLRIEKPSDDISDFFRARNLEISISDIGRAISDFNITLFFLKSADENLEKVQDALERVRGIVQRALDMSGEEIPTLIEGLESIYKEVLTYANSKVSGRFIFGGARIIEIGDFYKKPYEDREISKVSSWISQEENVSGGDNISKWSKGGKMRVEVYDGNQNLVLQTEINYLPQNTVDDILSEINLTNLLQASIVDGKIQITSLNPDYTFSIVGDTGGLISAWGGDGVEEYHGDDNEFKISNFGVGVPVGFVGREVFGDPSQKISGVLTTIKRAIDVLSGKSGEGIRPGLLNVLGDIDTSFSKIQSMRTRIGSLINLSSNFADFLGLRKADEEIRLSDVQDIDMPSATTDFNLKELITQTSMLTAVRSFEMTLLRFI